MKLTRHNFHNVLTSLLVSTLILLISSLAQAQKQNSRHIQSVYWKIEAPHSGKISYLLGSYHPFGKSWVDSHPEFYQHIDLANIFICESTTDTSVLGNQIDSISADKSRKTAEQIFGRATSFVDRHFLNMGWKEKPSELMNKMHTAGEQNRMIMRMASPLIFQQMNRIGIATEKISMDKALLNHAVENKKKIVTLDYAAILSDIHFTEGSNSISSQIVQLVHFLDTPVLSPEEERAKSDLLASSNQYKSGLTDYEKRRIYRDNDPFQVITRNAAWIPQLVSLLEQDNCFIAVGAGHFFVDKNKGIIEVLRKKGFIITPVTLGQ
ncbi:TraB/GumN family protein [Chitinophaga sp. RAB17]|uniref:TraB/GumN family protein n=1 Tax=Chitinophaga sp. RAB17 TaxID=3233049 RepID=UPI003F92BBBE